MNNLDTFRFFTQKSKDVQVSPVRRKRRPGIPIRTEPATRDGMQSRAGSRITDGQGWNWARV